MMEEIADLERKIRLLERNERKAVISTRQMEREIRILKRDKLLLEKQNKELLKNKRLLELQLNKAKEMLALVNGGQSKERW